MNIIYYRQVALTISSYVKLEKNDFYYSILQSRIIKEVNRSPNTIRRMEKRLIGLELDKRHEHHTAVKSSPLWNKKINEYVSHIVQAYKQHIVKEMKTDWKDFIDNYDFNTFSEDNDTAESKKKRFKEHYDNNFSFRAKILDTIHNIQERTYATPDKIKHRKGCAAIKIINGEMKRTRRKCDCGVVQRRKLLMKALFNQDKLEKKNGTVTNDIMQSHESSSSEYDDDEIICKGAQIRSSDKDDTLTSPSIDDGDESETIRTNSSSEESSVPTTMDEVPVIVEKMWKFNIPAQDMKATNYKYKVALKKISTKVNKITLPLNYSEVERFRHKQLHGVGIKVTEALENMGITSLLHLVALRLYEEEELQLKQYLLRTCNLRAYAPAFLLNKIVEDIGIPAKLKTDMGLYIFCLIEKKGDFKHAKALYKTKKGNYKDISGFIKKFIRT